MVKSKTKFADMKSAKDESTTTKNGTISKEKKRKRKDPYGKQEWQEEDQERYYNRLLHAAKKALRKESKVVRNFECQKMIRKIKERKKENAAAPVSGGGGDAANNKMGLALAEETYQQMKNLDLDMVVKESLRRLGILHLDPKLLEEAKRKSESVNNIDNNQRDDGSDNNQGENGSDGNDDDDDDDDARRESKPIVSEKEKDEHLVERILKHKKMQSALEHWNEQVTEYRRWSLRQQERDSQPYGVGGFKSNNNYQPTPPKKHKKKRTQNDQPEAAVVATKSSTGIPAQKSLFVKLGNEGDRVAQDGRDGQDLHYGPGSSIVEEGRKKNRKGQRARRAKAMAIEAKLAGRVHRPDESLNWRPKKQQGTIEEDNDLQHTYSSSLSRAHQKQQPSSARPERSGEKVVKSTEALHPSWAAAKKEPTGIVEFKGKKIVF